MTVVVIGAGIVGLSVAYELASRGARVRVLDPRGIGQGATRASAGILAPYIEGHIDSLLQLGLCSLQLYDEFVARVQADSGERVELERRGSLHVALDQHEATQLASTAQVLANARVDHQLTDSAGAVRLEPRVTREATAALLVRSHGYVAPAALTRALAHAAANRGALLSTVEAEAIDPSADRLEVRTRDEVIAADAVVLAAGSWSARLTGAGEWVKPIRGQLLQLRVASRPASRVIWGTGCYLVPWRDGTVLVGATVEDVGFDEGATAGGVRRLLDAAARLLPVLETARFEETRVGLRPMTHDELPAIGPSSRTKNLFYAAGHYRNGVLLAPLTAQLIADLVLEGREREQLALVRPSRLGL